MPETLYKLLFLVAFIGLTTISVHAQENLSADTVEIITMDSLLQQPSEMIETFQSKSILDPNKATFYSAVLPGLGQVYNKQYWKLPIIYSGAIVLGHFINEKHKLYNTFRNAYFEQINNGENSLGTRFNVDRLQRNAEKVRRDRDFLIIIGAVYYILNIVDAHVAAHLSEFDINSDLSLVPNYQEQTQFTTRSVGLSLRINLSK